MNELIKSLAERLEVEVSKRDKLSFLFELDLNECFNIAVSTLYLYSRPQKTEDTKIIFTIIASAIGHNIRDHYKLKKDSSIAVRVGAFFLYSFELYGITLLELKPGVKEHANYVLTILDDEAIKKLWASIPKKTSGKLPSETPYEPWTSTLHSTGARLIKTGERSVLKDVNPENTPLIFECVNKMQRTGWRLDEEILKIQKLAIKQRAPVFDSIWKISDKESKTSKIREVKTIFQIAEQFIGKTFYHLYYLDFRSRFYPSTAYLHEQGSDVARGLLRRAEKKPMTREGFGWLMIHLANCWAGPIDKSKVKTDKLPLNERYSWALANEDSFLEFATDPQNSRLWMNADAPWQFLSACFELLKLRNWQYEFWVNNPDKISMEARFKNYDFPSDLVCYIDGTTNGLQHLSALTRDEVTATHVNLIPQEAPGDLYNYIGAQIWSGLERASKLIPEDTRERASKFVETLIGLKRKVQESQPKTLERETALATLRAFKAKNMDINHDACIMFWLQITKASERRKIVKRNVMTIPYGGSAYGLGEQIIKDARKHGIDLLFNMEHRWGAFLGRYVFEGCKKSLKRPMRLLSIFEAAGKAAEERGQFLKWTTPVVNFPVVQHYVEGQAKKIWVHYGPKDYKRNTKHFNSELQLSVCFLEDTVISKGKQSQGAAPNIIHSLDATHLIMTVASVDFEVSTVHDSYGSLLCDMPKLYTAVRQTFYELYKDNPLPAILKEIGYEGEVEEGSLDISLVLESQFCFC